jgi:hypothetical protein
MSILHEDKYTFMIYLFQFLLEWEMFPKSFREIHNIFYAQ